MRYNCPLVAAIATKDDMPLVYSPLDVETLEKLMEKK